MGLWKQIKRKINENRLAMLRYGLPWSRLSPEQKREIILDVENAFLEGDNKVRFSRSAEGVSKNPYGKGRAGQEERSEGSTTRSIPPHASGKDERTHIPVEGGRGRKK
jgi:hypothetical protein